MSPVFEYASPVLLISNDGWNRFTECPSLSVSVFGHPTGLQLTFAVFSSGSESVPSTV